MTKAIAKKALFGILQHRVMFQKTDLLSTLVIQHQQIRRKVLILILLFLGMAETLMRVIQ